MPNGGIAFHRKLNSTTFGECYGPGKDYTMLFRQQKFFVYLNLKLTLEHDSIICGRYSNPSKQNILQSNPMITEAIF